MVRQRQLDPTGNRDTLIIGGGLLGLAVVAVGGAWASLHAAAWWTEDKPPAMNPARLVFDLLTGRIHWTSAATTAAGVLAVLLLALVVLAVLFVPGGKRMRPDRSTRYMARPADLVHLTAGGSSAKAKRLGLPGSGLPIGHTVAGRRQLFTSWEDTLILIAGPRTQKTTAYAIPTILAAPGACLATSNKRDALDATRTIRAGFGQVWVFDPQRVANTDPSWWWNPLSYIARRTHGLAGDDISETRAEKLAAQFVMSARPEGARTDAYFDSEAQNLIGLLLLAAACGRLPITTVYSWLTRPHNDEPAGLLESYGFGLQHESLEALSQLPDKQREGVYGTARALMGFLRARQIVAWVTPRPGLPEFDPAEFARSSDTLYPLSREGEGSVGPLVAALTMAVTDALEEYGTASPGGRLPVPFVAVLDEAANICKLRDLPGQYSHYGSRGIIPFTILQSWHQAADVWGDHGIEKLWSAANLKLYGGGVDDDRFLRRLSELIGSTEQIVRSTSTGRGHRTTSRSLQDKIILTPAELRELPPGRAVMFASGTPAVLIQPQPWWAGPHAEQIRQALA